MSNFSSRFEIIYKNFYDWGVSNGFKPSKLAFSRYIGISQGAMQKWEKGQLPSASHIKIIHDKLGFSYDWLITGQGEMFDKSQERLKELEAENIQLKQQLAIEKMAAKEYEAKASSA